MKYYSNLVAVSENLLNVIIFKEKDRIKYVELSVAQAGVSMTSAARRVDVAHLQNKPMAS